MSQLILRNIPDEVRKTIKKQAIDKGISMQQHILNIIVEYIKKDKIIIVKEGGKMKTGKWIELWDKENNRLLRIVYNPYLKPIKEVIAFWIPKEYQSLVKGKISR